MNFKAMVLGVTLLSFSRGPLPAWFQRLLIYSGIFVFGSYLYYTCPFESEVCVLAPLINWSYATLYVCVVLLAPILAILAFINPSILGFSQTHIGIYASITSILVVPYGVGGYWLLWLCYPLIFEIGMLIFVRLLYRRRIVAEKYSNWWRAPLTFVFLIGGWSLGILIASLQAQPHIVSRAEYHAGSEPYCIRFSEDVAKTAIDLMPMNMYTIPTDDHRSDFHALLAIGEGENRHYMNWSYRKGDFLPVHESVTIGKQGECDPIPHFARNLPLILPKASK